MIRPKMYYGEEGYIDLLRDVITQGDRHSRDRTAVGVRQVVGPVLAFNLQEGFPLYQSKRVPWKLFTAELLWMLSGDTNIRTLLKHGVSIWTDWPFQRFAEASSSVYLPVTPSGAVDTASPAYQVQKKKFEQLVLDDPHFAQAWGDIGPGYGKQWRRFGDADDRDGEASFSQVDQIARLINRLRDTPFSRRHLVSAWNPVEVDDMLLPPCHYGFEIHVSPGEDGDPKFADMILSIRSNDLLLGNPFNVGQYALLLSMIALQVDLTPRDLVVRIGNAHVYENHVRQVKELIARKDQLSDLGEPVMWIQRKSSIFDYRLKDVAVSNYAPLPSIAAPVAV